MTKADLDEASPDAWKLVLDRHRHGTLGFAADASWKVRLLQTIQENTLVTGSAFGGGKVGKAAGVFELLPEERRYFDPDYLDMQGFDDIVEAARRAPEDGGELQKQIIKHYGVKDAATND